MINFRFLIKNSSHLIILQKIRKIFNGGILKIFFLISNTLKLKRNPNVSEEEIVQFLGLLNVPSRVVDYGEGQMVTNIMVAHAGKHYRGPGTSTYYPPLTGMIPQQSVHLALEGRLNALFTEYSKQYCSKFSENFPAVYLSGENEDVIEGCCLMVIKPPSDKMTGQYHSTHQFVLKVIFFTFTKRSVRF